jgi:DNA-binding NarL/FixJ family response regulator
MSSFYSEDWNRNFSEIISHESICVDNRDVDYLLKSIKGDELAAAIRRVHAGESCFPAALHDHLAARAGSKPLTPREIETLDLLRRGLSNKDIGQILAISENTAKFHVRAILAKLEVTDRAEAVSAAYERGLLQVD